MSQSDANIEVRKTEEQAAQHRARLLGFEYLDSRGWSEQVDLIKDVLGVKEMYDYHAVPVALSQSHMSFVITTNTPQTTMRELKRRYPEYILSFTMISESGYKELMARHDPPPEIHYDDISIQTEGASDTLEQVSQTLETVRSDDILDYLITQADKLGASDIHLENEKDHVRLRFRIDGTLHVIAKLTKDKYRQLSSSIAVKANVSVAATEAQTGHISYELPRADQPPKQLNMRIETVPTSHGQDAVIRLFNLEAAMMNLESLGLSPNYMKEIKSIIKHPHGLVMVVGPTGSGKTTTLYSIMRELNQPTRKIITLENPVEYNFEGVMQIPVEAKSGREESFADKLRAVLRLDPDVIMVGEIRDADTAKTALQAALTGHLVLCTFHASNSAAALTRLMDIVGDNPLFNSAIRLILSQRLVRRLDDSTKQPYEMSDRIRQELQHIIDSLPEGVERPSLDQTQLYQPGSSPEVPFGYKGRIMIAEQLRMTPEMVELLQNGSSISTNDIQKLALEQGMVSLIQDGVLKALSGVTTIEEVYRNVDL